MTKIVTSGATSASPSQVASVVSNVVGAQRGTGRIAATDLRQEEWTDA